MKEKKAMVFLGGRWCLGIAALMMTIISIFGWNGVEAHRILLDTDMGTDDIFALLKLNTSQINLKGNGTAGYCRYRQAIPVGHGGRLDIDSNYQFRKSFLPQGKRWYSPLRQPTAQKVMMETISAVPTVVFLIGSLTNFAMFILSNPHLKKNIENIYIMGDGIRSKNPQGCCPDNANPSCQPQQCGDHGNLFTDFASDPYAEFNIFMDPFAAYQVIHSGIPTAIVPLDATNTILVNKNFLEAFEKNQHTYEVQYCFKSLKIICVTWFNLCRV